MSKVTAQRFLERLRSDSGQSTVEFGFVVPMLCFLILALVDLGIGVNDSIDATHLANQGARLAAVNANPSDYGAATLQGHIKSQAATKDLAVAGVKICLPTGGSDIGDPVKVIVTANFTVVPFINATFPVKGTSTMRLEQAPTNYTPDTSC